MNTRQLKSFVKTVAESINNSVCIEEKVWHHIHLSTYGLEPSSSVTYQLSWFVKDRCYVKEFNTIGEVYEFAHKLMKGEIDVQATNGASL